MFRKVLVANRGEIAVRVIRALRELGIPSVAVYSEVDRASLHVRMADEAVLLGPAPSCDSYLHIGRVVAAARAAGAEAVHPGYGFLSENVEFASRCRDAGLVFIGPPLEAIRRMGLKTEARRLALAAGVPVVPGTERPVADFEQARRIADQIGYPVMLKAEAGGGGKGMRRVAHEADLASAFRDAAGEAAGAFGSAALYLEKCIDRPRHIEVQVLGDLHGNVIHLGERECSLQRRHQKVIEECPSPLVAKHPEMRAAMGQAAIRVARTAGYHNAGTVEFLVDDRRNFYFLEMNTRLQVEHPVTELVTGVDLVHQQLRIAAGERLSFEQSAVQWRGAAVECRIYAEDPDNHFFPSPGRITAMDRPAGPGIRLDCGVYPGWTVPLEYDPLLAKLAVWAGTREEAVRRMLAAVTEYHVGGIKTNLSFFHRILMDERFLAGDLHTGFIDEFLAQRSPAGGPPSTRLDALAALVAAIHGRQAGAGEGPTAGAPRHSPWRFEGRNSLLR